jgi:hypothetical protein
MGFVVGVVKIVSKTVALDRPVGSAETPVDGNVSNATVVNCCGTEETGAKGRVLLDEENRTDVVPIALGAIACDKVDDNTGTAVGCAVCAGVTPTLVDCTAAEPPTLDGIIGEVEDNFPPWFETVVNTVDSIGTEDEAVVAIADTEDGAGCGALEEATTDPGTVAKAPLENIFGEANDDTPWFEAVVATIDSEGSGTDADERVT